MNLVRFGFALALIAISANPLRALARPWLFVSGYTHAGSAKECLEGAKKALHNSGFTTDLKIYPYEKPETGGVVDGLLPSSPVRAQIECDKTQGITSLGVSGLDAELTETKFREISNQDW